MRVQLHYLCYFQFPKRGCSSVSPQGPSRLFMKHHDSHNPGQCHLQLKGIHDFAVGSNHPLRSDPSFLYLSLPTCWLPWLLSSSYLCHLWPIDSHSYHLDCRIFILFSFYHRAIVPESGSVVPNHICYSCLWVVLVVFTHALASLRFNWTPYVVLHGLLVFWHLPTTCVLSTIIICRRWALSCLNGALPATLFALAKRRVDSSIP